MNVNRKEIIRLMKQHGGYWGEHPDYPDNDWRREVQDENTRQGYWEWVFGNIEDEEGLVDV